MKSLPIHFTDLGIPCQAFFLLKPWLTLQQANDKINGEVIIMPTSDIPDIIHFNRLNDVFFKALLGSEERKTLTLNFINAILNREGSNAFTAVTFSDKEIVPPRIDGKRSFLDVLVDHEWWYPWYFDESFGNAFHRTQENPHQRHQEAEKAGQERGEKIGDKTGRQALSTLLQKLLEEGRKEDFDRVLRDNEYQEKLLQEYHLKVSGK